MAYQSTIPQATDRLKDSQSDIQQNFAEIETFVTVNHVDFGNANQGKHKFVSMPVQVSDPAAPAGEVALYSKTGTDGNSQLFLRRNNVSSPAGDSIINFTQTILTDPAGGFTRLPSGILIKWGTFSITRNGFGTITFPTAGVPSEMAFTKLFSITGNMAYDTTPPIPSPTNTQVNVCPVFGFTALPIAPALTIPDFRCYAQTFGFGSTGGTVGINYVAIGF